MGFTSFTFFLFVPVVLAVFAALPSRFRLIWLAVASLIFYGSFGWENLVYLGLVVMVAHLSAQGIERAEARRRTVLVLAVAVLIGGLAAAKFGDFVLAELAGLGAVPLVQTGLTSPPGFSFYVFMATAYVVDVYRREATAAGAARSFLFLAWFPKILAGPIERAGTLMPQLGDGMRARPDLAALGLQLILWGLIKKVVIAENLAPQVDRTFEIVAYAPPMELLISLYFFAFQLYCDFSGYTDMAIGLSLLFGLTLMENFRRPYLSRSVGAFWSNRWHISLGRWFRDYLYIPLGGSRVGTVRLHLNLLIVFAASGVWHAGLGYGVGWAFLVWGLLNGLYVSVEIMLRPLGRRLSGLWPRLATSWATGVVRTLITFHLVLITWAFFRAETIDQAVLVLRRIADGFPDIIALARGYPFTGEHLLGFVLIIGLVAAEVLTERRPFSERMQAWPRVLRWSTWYAGIAALLVLGRWQDGGFIYMGF
jgi:alginate O-acetyltransferase complex protein AlgI